MYYVYIFQSLETGKTYKGMTNDLVRRLSEHENGRSSATRHMLPIKLLHVEICEDRVKAREMEKFFKSGYGREIIKEIGDMRMW